MHKTQRRAALGITALATVASTIALAVPAQAVTPSIWPTSGHIPVGVGCLATSVVPDPDGVLQTTFTDSGNPTISDVNFSGGTVVKAVPAGTAYKLNVVASEPCSGIKTLTPVSVHNGTWANHSPAATTEAAAFSGVWAEANVAHPDDAGLYKFTIAGASRRYDSFVLRADFTVVGTPVTGTGFQLVVGPWATKSLYILRATTLTNALSAASATKGKTIKATAVIKRATNAGYVADASAKVAVQTKVGTGKWVTNATLTANASGVVTYSFVLSATTQVRFVHGRTLSGNFTEAVISPIKVVKKI